MKGADCCCCLATAVAVVVEVTARTARIATVCVAATAKKELVAWCLNISM